MSDQQATEVGSGRSLSPDQLKALYDDNFIFGPNRRYVEQRFIIGFQKFVGYSLIVVGILAFVLGFGMAASMGRGIEFGFVGGLVSFLPAIFLIWAGVQAVGTAQMLAATLDSAEASIAMLRITRGDRLLAGK